MIEKVRAYRKRRIEISEKIWFRILNTLFSLLLACLTVLSMLTVICTRIPFRYEVNDDAVFAQILSGAYTGRPDAHAIFIKYPLSWIISLLYKRNPSIELGQIQLSDVNWYLASLLVLYGFAMIAVLFRLLLHFRCNRLLICFVYALAFIMLWMPCFSTLTYSTASAFLGCMALLYLALESKDEAWRPWNLMVFAILLTASYCLRVKCFYMILPFLLVELLIKYHLDFFRSWKPWFFTAFLVLLAVGIYSINYQAYHSEAWREYNDYNYARAMLQDYEGYPDYGEHADFYASLDISSEELEAVRQDRYCLLDDFSIDWFTEINQYVQEEKGLQTWFARIRNAGDQVVDYVINSNQAGQRLKFYSFYFWMILLALLPITMILRWKSGFRQHLLYLLEAVIYLVLLVAEWFYLAIMGRYPARVEESMRWMMFIAAFVLICHLLESYKEVSLCRLPAILQLVIIVCLSMSLLPQIQEEIYDRQQIQESYSRDYNELLTYIGEHEDSYYILDAATCSAPALPSDKYSTTNWCLSGNWAAFSPLYEEKLQNAGTDTLSSAYLMRENVYLITREQGEIASLLGKDVDQVTYEIVDEYHTTDQQVYEIIKITGVYDG